MVMQTRTLARELANRYSDEQGRRMINGVLRRLQNATA